MKRKPNNNKRNQPKHLKGYSVVNKFDEVRIVKSELFEGIVNSKKALQISKENELDLICVTEKANPPVCIIEDYGKYLYQQEKEKKELKKKNKNLPVKEVRLSPNIGDGDFETKVKQARNFLTKGHEVKLAMQFKGRQNKHVDLGLDTINDFIDEVSDISEVMSKPKKEGRWMRAQLKPPTT